MRRQRNRRNLRGRRRATAAATQRIRVALVADTHGHVDARVADVASNCDYVAHAGDVGGRRVLEALHEERVRARGSRNNDTPEKWPAAERGARRRLASTAELELPGRVLVIVHGDRAGKPSSRHERLRARYPYARAVAYGHTHRLVCDREAIPRILNPGAAGRARTFGGPSCLLLEAGARGWRLRAPRFPPVHG